MLSPEILPASSSSQKSTQFPTYADFKSSMKASSMDAGTETRRQAAVIDDDDERLLARIGYKQVHCLLPVSKGGQLKLSQELRREFTKWSTVSYAISIEGVLGSVPATFGIAIIAGGPATAVWCWLIGSFMSTCIALSSSYS